jgi:RNA polymerase sigma factor (sigma-70 family)
MKQKNEKPFCKQGGSREFFTESIESVKDDVLQLARVLVSNSDIAESPEDLAQHTLQKAWEHRETWSPKENGSFKSWVCTILRNKFIDVYRKRRRFHVDQFSKFNDDSCSDPLFLRKLLFSDDDTPDVLLEKKESSDVTRAIHECIERYATRNHKEIFDLWLQGCDATVMAERLGINDKRVINGRKFYAKESLRKNLQKHYSWVF